MKFSLLLLCFMICLFACKHDVVVPDLPEISFQGDVQSIIIANCSESGCHSGNGGEFPLVSYDEIQSHVTPGDARESEIYKSITGKGATLMPPSPRPVLTNDAIRLIYIWIQQGAKNN
jgi:hypothetical protein